MAREAQDPESGQAAREHRGEAHRDGQRAGDHRVADLADGCGHGGSVVVARAQPVAVTVQQEHRVVGAHAEQHDRQKRGGGLVDLEAEQVRGNPQQAAHSRADPEDGRHHDERQTRAAEQQQQQDQDGRQHAVGGQPLGDGAVRVGGSLPGHLCAQAAAGQRVADIGADVGHRLVGLLCAALSAEADRHQRDLVVGRGLRDVADLYGDGPGLCRLPGRLAAGLEPGQACDRAIGDGQVTAGQAVPVRAADDHHRGRFAARRAERLVHGRLGPRRLVPGWQLACLG